jgi:hypothetical protein
MVAHQRLRKVGAIGIPVDIPRVIAEHLAEVGEIGGALGRIVGAEVGAGGGEFAVAGLGRGQMRALCRLGVEAEAKELSSEVVDRRASKRRFREHSAALAHHHDVTVVDEVGGDEPIDFQRGDVARPTGQIDNGIASFLRGAGGVFRDHQPDIATGRPAAILRHDEIAAARVGEPFDAFQFRAWRRLVTRHSRSSFGGLCGSRHGG